MKKFLGFLAVLGFMTLASVAFSQDATEEPTPKTSDDVWDVPAGSSDEEASSSPVESSPKEVKPHGYPIGEIDRPLALPPMTLEPRMEFGLNFLGDNYWGKNQVFLAASAGFGIIKNLEAGTRVDLFLADEFRAGDFSTYAVYQLPEFVPNLMLAGQFTLHLLLSDYGSFFTRNLHGADAAMIMDVLAKYKIHQMFAAVATVGMGASFGDNLGAFIMNFEVGALVQPIEPLAIWMFFGFYNNAGDAAKLTTIPLMLRGQYTLLGNLDITLDMGFFDLNHAGADFFRMVFGAAYRLDL